MLLKTVIKRKKTRNELFDRWAED